MKWIVFSLALTLPACVTAHARDREGPVAFGQTAYVGEPRVCPERVIEDSRCPMNARCVWAGRVVIRVAVTTGRGTHPMDFELGRPVPVADGALTLTSVTPDRVAGRKLQRSDYRFTFAFAGGF